MSIEEQIAWIGSIQYWFQKEEGASNLDIVKDSLRRLKKLEAENAQLKRELEQIEKGEQKKFELYQQFIELYDQFCRSYIGVGAKLDGMQGKAMKNIIAYLTAQSKTKDEQGALAAWQFILAHWGHLTKFIQNQNSLVQINKNLQEILTQLRRGKDQQTAKQTAIEGTRQRIIERQRNAGADHPDDQQP
jgi:uncharacterized protein (DUF3084 family)